MCGLEKVAHFWGLSVGAENVASRTVLLLYKNFFLMTLPVTTDFHCFNK